MEMIFNDQDRDSIVALKSEIDALDIENALKRRIALVLSLKMLHKGYDYSI